MKIAARIAAHPGKTILAGVLLAVLAVLPASRLRLQADLAALLPSGTEAAEDYRLFIETFGGFEKVFLLIVPAAENAGADDPGLLLDAAGRLAEALEASPEVASVRSGLEQADEDFFLRYVVRRAPLLLPERSLDRLEQVLDEASVRDRAATLRATIHSPAGAAKLPLLRQDPLELSLDLPLFGAAGLDVPVDGVTGGFLAEATEDAPPVAMVILTPAQSEVDPEGGRRLVAELDRAWTETIEDLSAALGRSSDDPGLRMLAVGGPLYAVQDETIIRQDLEATIFGSALGCTLLLLLAFGGPRIPFGTLAGLGVGLVWGAGVLGGVVGELTAPGLGFAAVLVGLGIDYGIHGGVRYRQHRLDGDDPQSALVATFRHAGPAILTSAATTAAAFATLGLAHFRPLRELGWVVSIGIVAILCGSATVGAAVIAAGRGSAEAETSRTPGRLWRALDALVRYAVDAAIRHRGVVLAVAAVLSAVAFWGATRLELSTDMRSLRPSDHPALEAEEILATRFAVGLETTTLVVRGDGLAETLERSAAARRTVLEAVPAAEVVSPTDWLVDQGAARARLARLAELPFGRAADVLEEELRAQNVNPAAFADGLDALRAFGRGVDPGAPGPGDYPEGLAELLRLPAHSEEDRGSERGATFAALQVRLPDGSWPDGPPEEVIDDLGEAAPGIAVASVVRLGATLRDVAGRDLGVLFTAALGMVAAVVLIAFRGRLVRAFLALLPVLLGSLWTLGLWGLTGHVIDLLGLAVLPILLGIGIDDGLHAVHGSDDVSQGGIEGSIRAAGLAMSLTTLTTCVGFGSLLLSSLPGLRAGGALVAGGVFACLAATLFVLPALASYGRKRP